MTSALQPPASLGVYTLIAQVRANSLHPPAHLNWVDKGLGYPPDSHSGVSVLRLLVGEFDSKHTDS